MNKPGLEEFIELIRKAVDLPANQEVSAASYLPELGVDSMRMMFLVNEIDKHYGVILELVDFYRVATIGELHRMIISSIK